MVRVLYIQPAEGFGGAERQGVLHIARLIELGFEVVPLVGPGEPIRRALEREGVKDYVFVDRFFTENDRPLGPLEFLGRQARLPGTWLGMQALLDGLITERRIDLVFASRSYGWVVGSRAAINHRIPLIWRGGSRITSRLEKAGLRLLGLAWPPDALVCNCEAVRRDLAPLLACPSHIVPNGVDVARFDPDRVEPRLRRQLGIGPEVPVVGMAGRPAPEKGLELLAEAVARTARSVPGVRVLIAGEFGWRDQYERLFRGLGLAERVTVLGHLEEVEQLYASCDVVVLSSRARSIEGSPNAVLEAMAMRRPVVATRVGGLAEVIEHGVEGFLARAEDSEDLALHLVKLLLDRDLRQRQGAAGRATVLRRFDDRAVASQLGALFVSVLERAADRAASMSA